MMWRRLDHNLVLKKVIRVDLEVRTELAVESRKLIRMVRGSGLALPVDKVSGLWCER